MHEWKRGLPRGKLTSDMLNDYEVAWPILDGPFHRRRTAEEKAAETRTLNADGTVSVVRHPSTARGEANPKPTP